METDITTKDLTPFAEACVYAKDWETGWQLFMLGWAMGRNVNYGDLLDFVVWDSQRYPRKQGRVSSPTRNQLARWAERFLAEKES